MDLYFRPARPEDADRAARLIYSAGPAPLFYVFSTKRHEAIDFVRFAFADGAGTLGYQNHIAAEIDGRLAAVGAFYPADDYERLGREMMEQIFRFYGLFESIGVLLRAGRLAAVTPRPEENALFIENIDVALGMQKKGVCTALFAAETERARREEFRCCILDTSVTNARARTLYEKLGFRIVRKHCWPYAGTRVRVPDHIRMKRIL